MRDKRRKPTGLPCDELRPDDGIDPRILFRRETRTRSQTRRDGQLARHAFRVFSLILDQLGTEDWARGMYLSEVTPAPDASRLRLAIAFTEPKSLDEAEQALAHLRAISGQLRWELAATISRKKVPDLVFGLAGKEAEDDTH